MKTMPGKNVSGMANVKERIQWIKDSYTKDLPMFHFDLFYAEEYPYLPIVKDFEEKTRCLNDQFKAMVIRGN